MLDVLERIDRLESLGIAAAWVSNGQIEFDALSLLAAGTEHIALGTGIVRTWPRHPVVTVQQSLTLAKLAPGRTRLGVGPAHHNVVEEELGFEFKTPLTNLRDRRGRQLADPMMGLITPQVFDARVPPA